MNILRLREVHPAEEGASMNRPVIAIVSPGSFVVPSATSSSVELVIEQVARRMTHEVRPVVFGRTSRIRPSLEETDGVRYVRVRAPSPLAYIRNVSRKLAEYKPQVIQVENRPRFVRYLRRVYPRANLLLVLHSLVFVSEPHIGEAELRSCLAAADGIIVNSFFLKEQIIRKAPRVKHKIAVNHLGVDTGRFTPRWTAEAEAWRRRTLEQMGLAGKKIVMYVGRLIPLKGVDYVLRAMPKIIEREPNAVLLIIGSASYGSDRTTPYVRHLHKLGAQMPNHVRFISYVPHTEIALWYRIADVLVVPSTRREAFGLVNVEAMATGVPVVAARIGGMKEIIEHEQTGYLIDVPLLESELPLRIHSLLATKETARRFGEQSIQRVHEQFSWERTVRRWLAIYSIFTKKLK